jgi:hypothetical protein
METMMNRFGVLALVFALSPAVALADERPYAFTYEPVVSAEGENELELYETLSQPRRGGAAGRVWEHKLEVGRGLTDRLSLSGYGVFRSTRARSLEFSAIKLEGRYKLLDATQSPVDVVLYLEGEKEVVDDKPWGVEEKIILGHDHGRFSWALNLIAEQEFPSGGGTETRWGWSGGAAVKVASPVRLGVESFGTRHREVDGTVLWEAYAGPTAVLTLPSGPFNSAWLIVGAGFGLNDTSDRIQARVVLGGDF